MRGTQVSLAAAVVLVTAVAGWTAEIAPAGGKAKFVNDFSPGVAKVVTRAKLLNDGLQFQLREGEGQVDVLGASMQMQVLQDGVTVVAGLDLNGNGTIDRNEAFPVRENMAGALVPTAGEDGKKVGFPVAIKFMTLIRNAKVRTGKVTMAVGSMYAAGGKKGTINGVEVTLIDDNLDGKYSQDGRDAIVIGRTTAAVPLGTMHKIGNLVYQLKVAEDGSSVEFTPQKDLKLNVTELQFKSSAVACFVIEGEKGTYDVVASGKTGLPAGEYRFAYGAICQGNDVFPILPRGERMSVGVGGKRKVSGTEGGIRYTLSEDCVNTLIMGSPFYAHFSGAVGGGKVTVNPSVAVEGAAGERYGVHFDTRIRPSVIILNDKSVVSASPMGFG